MYNIMSIEAVPFTDNNGEQKKLYIADTDNPLRKIIVPPEGPRVYREQLAASIGNKAIEDIFLYRPDPEEVDTISEIPIVKMGGLWTIGHHYTKQAIDMAQHGHDFATFVPNFQYPVWRPLFDSELRKSPYIWHAKNGRQVTKSVLAHTGAQKARISGHSYAGHTVTHMASHDPQLFETIVLEDPSGPTSHNIRPSDLLSQELKPALAIMSEDLDMLPPNTVDRSIRRITDHGIHAAREILGLAKMRPAFRPNLVKAREAGIPVGLLLLSRSAIFNSVEVRSVAEAEKLFDLIDEVDEYHIAPNIRPVEVDITEHQMFEQLSAQLAPKNKKRAKNA